MGQVPYFHCPRCGVSLNPVAMIAHGLEGSLDAAAKILSSRPEAFSGTNIEPYLNQALEAERWKLFFHRHRGEYIDTIQSYRLITDPRTDTSTLLYDRCEAKLTELIREFPTLRRYISLDVGTRRKVIVQMNYNAAGAAGQIEILTLQGALLHAIYLDHQTPANHLYLAVPPLMLRCVWKDHLAIFNDHRLAADRWDWIMEWLSKSAGAPPVVAVASLRGRPDRADIQRVTVLPIGLETAWTGTAFAGGFTRIGVKRLRDNCHRDMTAREELFMLDSRESWGGLPNILEDFTTTSLRMLEAGEVSTFRSFVEETMSLNCLTLDEKNLVTESLGQRVGDGHRRLMESIISEVCDSPPLVLMNTSYLVSRGCYVREDHRTGRRSQITNFRSRVVLRLLTAEMRQKVGSGPLARRGGSINVVRSTNEKGESTYCMVNEAMMAVAGRLVGSIRDSFVRAGLGLVQLIGREPLLGQIIEGTQGSAIEVAEFPCLGFHPPSFSFNYPEVTLTPLGETRRQMSCREVADWVTGLVMEQRGDLKRFQAFTESCCSGGDTQKALAKAVAVVTIFAFRASRSRDGFDLSIRQPELFDLVAKVAGLKVLDSQGAQVVENLPIYVGNVPFALKGVHFRGRKSFSYHISQDSEFDPGHVQFRVVDQICTEGLDIAAMPAGALNSFVEAALCSKNVEGVVRSALTGFQAGFINLVLGNLGETANCVQDELDVFIEFLERRGMRRHFVIELPDDPGKVAVRKNAVEACFEDGNANHVKKRIESALRERVGRHNVASKRISVGNSRDWFWVVPNSLLHASDIIRFA